MSASSGRALSTTWKTTLTPKYDLSPTSFWTGVAPLRSVMKKATWSRVAFFYGSPASGHSPGSRTSSDARFHWRRPAHLSGTV